MPSVHFLFCNLFLVCFVFFFVKGMKLRAVKICQLIVRLLFFFFCFTILHQKSRDNEEEHYFSTNEQRLLILLIQLGQKPTDNLDIYFVNDEITNEQIDILLNSDDMYQDYIEDSGYTPLSNKRRSKWEEVAKFLKRRF